MGERALRDHGAELWRARAAAELERLGRRAAGTGERALSARELEIARAVAGGATNKEIAAALFLSEKTVETHQRSNFRKLGVASRRAVAPALDAQA